MTTDSIQPGDFKRGLVAYFDILGFKSIPVDEEEDLQSAARLVNEFAHAQNRIRETQRVGDWHLHEIQWLVFADSILLYREIPPSDWVQEWHNFFVVCQELMTFMFNSGLPLRGAISTGKLFIKKHCFVGRPIVDCYELANRTLWSGCVLTPIAQSELEAIWKSRAGPSKYRKIMKWVLVPYSVPMKQTVAEGVSEKPSNLVIKWFHQDRLHSTDEPTRGIPEAVRECFEAHGKKLPDSAICKLTNTVEFLLFVDTLCLNANTPRKVAKVT